MDLHLFDLNLLVALDALLTECNVTQAGNRLNLSQPAMSGALARLRSHFNDELLVPAGRRMIRTPLGDTLAQPVRELLLQTRSTLAVRPNFDAAASTRRFSIAVSDYVTTVLLADVFRRVAHLAPHMTFEMRSLGHGTVEALDTGELDFLIRPAAYLIESHPSEVLFEDVYTCVVCANNTTVGDTLTVDEYLGMGHVVVSMNPPSLGFDEEHLRKGKFRRRVEVSASNFALAPELVVGTGRVATMHSRLALAYAAIMPVRVLPMPIELPRLVEMVQWHRVFDLDPAHRWFRRVLKEASADMPVTPFLAG